MTEKSVNEPVPSSRSPDSSTDLKWRRLPEERPQQILMAAIDAFGEHGIAATRLEDIAARAGVSKGTIYLYFESKEDLFREVVRQVLVPRMQEVERALDSGTPTEQLERYMRLQWEHFERRSAAGWIRLVVAELHKHPDLAAVYYTEAVSVGNKVLGGILRRGMDTGEFRAMDPLEALAIIKAIALMNVLWSQTPLPTGAGTTVNRAARIDTMVDFVLHALRPAPAAAPETR